MIGITALLLTGCASQEEQVAKEEECALDDLPCIETMLREADGLKRERRQIEMRNNNQRHTKPD